MLFRRRGRGNAFGPENVCVVYLNFNYVPGTYDTALIPCMRKDKKSFQFQSAIYIHIMNIFLRHPRITANNPLPRINA